MIHDLNERNRQILKLVIDSYLATGEPVGSGLVAQRLGLRLSPATVRNAMSELEERGLLYAPHTSAGRLPTEAGLEVFVETLLEVRKPSAVDRATIEREMDDVRGQALPDILEQTSAFLSGLSSCAGMVFAPTAENRIKQIEFVLLAPGRALVVLVSADGGVENRMLEVERTVTATDLERAANYLNARVASKTLAQAVEQVKTDMQGKRDQLDTLTARLAEAGIAKLSEGSAGGHLFISGQVQLLSDVAALEDLERVRALLGELEARANILTLLQATMQAEGVKIFIGADNRLFRHSGSAMIVSAYHNPQTQAVGVIGVIGPARLNYGRIVSVVNYTSQMMGSILE